MEWARGTASWALTIASNAECEGVRRFGVNVRHGGQTSAEELACDLAERLDYGGLRVRGTPSDNTHTTAQAQAACVKSGTAPVSG